MNRSSIAPGILAQAWPILFGQLAVMAYGVIDTMMTGHSSPADLAAMGVGASIYGSVFVSLMDVVNALNPIIAQHYGAQCDAAIGASYAQGLCHDVALACGRLTGGGSGWSDTHRKS